MIEHEAVAFVLDALHNKAYKHPVYHNHHEAYGMLLEEVAEYFEHVRERKPDMAGCREELADIAAVCLKALTQLCVEEEKPKVYCGIIGLGQAYVDTRGGE